MAKVMLVTKLHVCWCLDIGDQSYLRLLFQTCHQHRCRLNCQRPRKASTKKLEWIQCSKATLFKARAGFNLKFRL